MKWSKWPLSFHLVENGSVNSPRHEGMRFEDADMWAAFGWPLLCYSWCDIFTTTLPSWSPGLSSSPQLNLLSLYRWCSRLTLAPALLSKHWWTHVYEAQCWLLVQGGTGGCHLPLPLTLLWQGFYQSLLRCRKRMHEWIFILNYSILGLHSEIFCNVKYLFPS